MHAHSKTEAMSKTPNYAYRTRCALALLVLGVVIYATVHVLPSPHIRIAVGPVGGSFYDTARQYKRILEKKGYRVDIVPFQKTDEIGEQVADAKHQLDLGFVSEDLSGTSSNSLMSLGDVQLQPIFFFESNKTANARPIRSFSDLRGMSIVLPPLRSLTSRTLLTIFAQSGVDPNNTHIAFLPLDQGIQRLKQGQYDAGLFILGADSPLMADLAEDADLQIVQPAEQQAIAKKLSYLRVVTLPAGVFDLAHHIPSQDVTMLAATISVVARRDMPDATQYALLEAMQEVHHGGSYVSQGSEFPRYSDNTGVVEQTVDDFYRNGTPWVYAHFSIWVASIVDAYLAPLLALSFGVSVLGAVSELEKFKLFMLFLFARTVIWRLHRLRARGVTPSESMLTVAGLIESGLAREEDHTRRWANALRNARQG